MENGEFWTMKAIPAYKGSMTTLGSLLDKGVDPKYNLPEDIHQWQYLKGAKRMERVAKTGHTYIYSEGPVAFPDALDKPARTMLTSEGTVNRASHVICDPETKKLRILTPNEANKIQGFPEHWTNTGMSERFQYFCMGNALVPGIIERMGKTLGRIIEDEP
ncbi:DNA cytosine methyltransferase [uncultured Mitsuokella sp.]|uniref:DNA cytosine methyltransferase n=1 Tax=uncultured Mitsuokella sp. TaxID=453120 RepID=UPI00266CBB1C|nr:DNA cytosine methyltransferase [uncultured Mitsuokella sp.]